METVVKINFLDLYYEKQLISGIIIKDPEDNWALKFHINIHLELLRNLYIWPDTGPI